MTTTPSSKCSHIVAYDFGDKTAQCGASVNGHPLLCDACSANLTAKSAPADTVRSVCEAALQQEQKALESVLAVQEQLLQNTQRTEAQVITTRARIADLQAFLATH